MASPRSFFVRFILLCGVALATPAVGQEQPPVPVGDVELAVRDPRGKPLNGAAVEILPFEREHPLDKRTAIRTTTDDRGAARFS